MTEFERLKDQLNSILTSNIPCTLTNEMADSIMLIVNDMEQEYDKLQANPKEYSKQEMIDLIQSFYLTLTNKQALAVLKGSEFKDQFIKENIN